MTVPCNEFEDAASAHGRCTEIGDAKKANRAYGHVVRAAAHLREGHDQGLFCFHRYLDHPDSSVRAWAAYYLLEIDEEPAIATLREIGKESGLVAFSAKIALQEWQAGRLKII